MSVDSDTLVTVAAVLDNDKEILSDFLRETAAVLGKHYTHHEILLVDNGSSDGAAQEVQMLQSSVPNVRLIRLSRRYESEMALAAALDNSIGDYVVLMDPRADPPAMIPEMVERAASGFDVVIGQSRSGQQGPWFRRLESRIFYRIASAVLGCELRPNTSIFRVFSRQVVNSITRVRNKNRSLKYLNALVGFRQMHLEYDPVRKKGDAVKPFRQSASQALDLIVTNSALPLRAAVLIATIASILNLAYFGYILVVSLVKDKVAEGWITTNVTHTAMFLMLFIVLMILVEYVARIIEEIQDRPLYFIEYETNSTVTSYKKAMAEKLNIV